MRSATLPIQAFTNPTEQDLQVSVPYYIKACALGIPAYLIGVHLWTWIFFGSAFLHGAADFRSMYSAAWAVRLGQASRLYDLYLARQLQDTYVGTISITLPYMHPPFEAVLLEPLTHLSYLHAYLLVLFLNMSLLALTLWMMRGWIQNLSRIYSWLPGALFLAFLPVAAALIQGQDSLVLLAILTGAAGAMDRESDVIAGLLVGLGLFRFQLTLPIALLFLFWRRWRFLAGFSVSATVLAACSFWIMGRFLKSYFRLLLGMGVEFRSEANEAIYGSSLHVPMMSNVRALVAGATHLSGFWFHAVVVIISAIVFIIAVRTKIQHRDSLLLAIAVCVPISYHLFMHDLSLLLLPILVGLDDVLLSETSSSWTKKLPARLAALAFVTPLLFSYAPWHFWIACMSWLAFAVSQCFFLGSAREPSPKPCFS